MKLLHLLPITLLASALSASAASFDFYKLSGNPALPGDFTPSNGSFQAGDIVSSKNGNLIFTSGGITATATSSYAGDSWVVQDHEPGWTLNNSAGLGVYHIDPFGGSRDGSDDNITAGETLTITFDQVVNIESIGVRAEGHDVSWADGTTFLLDGVDTVLPEGVNGGLVPVNKTGTSFTVAYGGADADQLYLASVVATSVPDGGATAALLGLSILGFGSVRRQLAKK